MAFVKWIGGALGFAMGGPIGALMGFAFGSMFDGAEEDQKQQDNTFSFSYRTTIRM